MNRAKIGYFAAGLFGVYGAGAAGSANCSIVALAGVGGGNSGGAILGAGIGVLPMLLELTDQDTGEFGDSELLWVPLISFTIPMGAALGHRYLNIL